MGNLSPRLAASAGSGWLAEAEAAVSSAPSPEAAASGLERLADVGGMELLGACRGPHLVRLAMLLGCGPAPTRSLVARGRHWPEVLAYAAGENPRRADLEARFGLRELSDRSALRHALRQMADLELLRIAGRDIGGQASLSDTLEAVTRLADVAIDTAVRVERAALAAEFGEPRTESGRPVGFVVLGLGKLGGCELNYSSDVDLVYLYETDETTGDGPQAGEFFAKLAGAVTSAIGEATADGIVFRVDLRLRPEGHNGPLVNSVENALRYYEGWGDTWERGALMKARPVAGELEVGRAFVAAIAPFIYRRHLDYLTVEDLRTMKSRIDLEARSAAAGKRDVKIGAGGIREIEFVAQALQLIHSGHVAGVRALGTRDALSRLREHGFMPADDEEVLQRAYEFLRNAEHAVQVEDRRQTQTLPTDPRALLSFARRMGYGRGVRGKPAGEGAVAAFEADWRAHTEAVRMIFVKFMELRPGQGDKDPQPEEILAGAVLAGIERGDVQAAAPSLETLGFSDGASAAALLERIYRGRFQGPASPQRRRAMRAMAPVLLRAVGSSSDPDRALQRLVEFLVRTGAHTSYLALLGGSPATMEILVDLFASSPYLAAQISRRPELIDSLVRSDAARPARTREELRRALGPAALESVDPEALLSMLRRFRTAELVRIGMADLAGVMEPEQVHRQLSLLAEVCLCAAADAALVQTAPAAGGQVGRDLAPAIIAMGKLGAAEMTYGSDLDLIFIYDASGRSFDAQSHAFAARWAQKTIALLQTRTADGVVYAVDTRLRPSGNSDPLVTSLDRFVSYQRTEADLWERQALLRARVVYGQPSLRSRIEQVVTECLYTRGLDDAGLLEIVDLRARVERELAHENDVRFNIKTGRGGLVDIEFMVQALQLRYGRDCPEIRKRATLEAIRAAGAAGFLERSDAESLAADYRFLRRLEARMRLERDRPVEELEADPQRIRPLAKRMGFAGEHAGEQLVARYRAVRERVRGIYERYLGSAFESA